MAKYNIYVYDSAFSIHSPNELPEVDHYGLSIANGFESRVVATPIISRASKAVRSMPMNIRQCIFENENFLSYYRWVRYFHLLSFFKYIIL